MGNGFGKTSFGGPKIPGIGSATPGFGRPGAGIPMKSSIPDPILPEPRKLSPEEIIRMNPHRQVDIPSGQGTESTRGSKPLPRPHKARMELANLATIRRQAMDTNQTSKQRAQPDAPLRFYTKDETRVRSQIISDAMDTTTASDTTEESSEETWAQLKKKAEESRAPQPQELQDPIAEAQAKREQEAGSGAYTPLKRRIPSERGSFSDIPRADMWSRPNNYGENTMTSTSQSIPASTIQASQNRAGSRSKFNTTTKSNPEATRPVEPVSSAEPPRPVEPVSPAEPPRPVKGVPSGRRTMRPGGSFGLSSFSSAFGKVGASGFEIPGLDRPSPPIEPVEKKVATNSVKEPIREQVTYSPPIESVEKKVATSSVKEPIQEQVTYSPQATERHEVHEVPDVREQVINQFSSQEELDRRHRRLLERFGGSETTHVGPNYRDHSLPKHAHGKVAKKQARRNRELARDEDDDEARELAEERAELKRQRKLEKAAQKAAAPTPMILPEFISVSNLAVALKVRLEDFLYKLEELGFEGVNHDHILNAEDAGLIAMEYNYEAIIERGESEDLKARPAAEDPLILPPRAPVVTIMGHVDHGKTTILDYLRKSSVAASEHGGITQHIGAFSVPMSSGKTVTFLDTPGHEAFLSMRQRGANVTDIVILVVAADDSVKPQTIEAINHAKAAKVPIIVAINKIDRPEIDIDRVKQDLARHGVEIEDYGGDTQVVCVSGKTGKGMDDLEESIITLSEILDMRAEIDGPAEGYVIEASIKSMGKVATILVRRGTMRIGDFIVAGKTWARIRCLRDEAGTEIEEAGPGIPVEVDGWRVQPLAGDEVLQAPDEAKAKSVVEFRLEREERDKMADDMDAINENRKLEHEKREREKAEKEAALTRGVGEIDPSKTTRDKGPSGPKPVFFVVKGDVTGSVEAVVDQMNSASTKEVEAIILRSSVGKVSESDIEHAATAKGYVINFNTEIEPNISQFAAQKKVKILDHNIIYRLMDDVRAEMSKFLPPLVTQRVLGEAIIAQIFDINVKGRKYKSIAGCKIRNGTVSRDARYRVLRDGEKVFDGMLYFLLYFQISTSPHCVLHHTTISNAIYIYMLTPSKRQTRIPQERQERCSRNEKGR